MNGDILHHVFSHFSLMPSIRAMRMRIWQFSYPSGYTSLSTFVNHRIVNHQLGPSNYYRTWKLPDYMISILYVDDEPGLLEIGKLFLEQSGQFHVDTTISATGALTTMQSKVYDAIISDYQMPGMDGIEFLKMVRSSGNSIPFILFTGKGREEVVIQALNEGADFYLQKGGDPEAQFAELHHKVRVAVLRRTAEASLAKGQEQHLEILRTAMDGYMLMDTKGCILEVNKAYSLMSGYSQQKLLTMNIHDLEDVESTEATPGQIQNVVTQGKARFESQHRRKDGSTLFLEINAHYQPADGGRVIAFLNDITERKKADEALRESEAFLNNIIQIAPVGIGVSTDRIIQSFNDQFCQITGYTSDEIVGHSARMLYPSEEEYDYVGRELFGKMHANGTVETRWTRKDGAIIDVQFSTKPVDPSNFSAGVIFTALDITDRKRAEVALRDSEERFRLLASNATDVIWTMDFSGRFTYISPSVMQLRGYTPEEVLVQTIDEALTPASAGLIRKRFELILAELREGKPLSEFRGELEQPRKDGSTVWTEVTSKGLYNERNELVGIIGVSRDISNRKLAEKALRESEERFRGITERISDMIIITDSHGKPTYTSPSVQAILGFPPEYYIGVGPNTLNFPHEDIIKIGLATKRLLAGSSEEHVEFRMKKSDGTYVIFEGTGIPLLEGDTYTGVQVIARDITRQKQAEESLRIQHDLSIELNKCHLLDDACNRILSAALQVGGLDAGGIYIADPDSGDLDLIVSDGVSSRFSSLVAHFQADSPQVRWAENGKPFYGKFHDIRQPEYDEIREKEGITTVACIPVMHEGNLLGLVNVASHSLDTIPSSSRQILETLALQVGSAVSRIQSRLNLLSSETRYRSLVENLNDVVFTVDRDGLITYVSPVGERQYGYSSADLLGKPFATVVFPDDVPALQQRFHEVSRGIIVPFEWRLVHKDGSISWVRTSTRPVVGNTGEPVFFGIISDISREKQIGEALQQSEERYKSISSSTTDFVFSCVKPDEGCNYSIDWIAGAVERITGYTIGEVNAMGCWRCMVHPDDIPVFDNNITRLPVGTSSAFILRILTKKGTVTWLEVHTTNIPFQGVQPENRIFGGCRDITERKTSEEKVKESEESLRSTLASIDDLVFTLDENDIFVGSYNPDVSNLYVLPEEFMGKSLHEVLPKELADQLQRIIEEVKITGKTQQVEYCLPLQGKIAWFNAKLSPRYSLNATFTGVTCVARDISERRRVEEALQESEEKFREIFENANDAITLLGFSPDGMPSRFTEVNENACRISGFTRDEMLSMSPKDLDDPTEWNEARGFTQKIMEQGYCVFERSLVRKDGNKIPIEISSHMFTLNNKKVMLSIFRDITGRKRAEKALLQANRKLKLLSGITRHDISNQLLVLNGFLKILHKKTPDEALEDFFTRINKASSRISSMIQFTREYEEIGVNAPVWQDCRTLVDNAAKEALSDKVSLINDLSAGVEVFADPLITKVCYNLMDNAVRHGGKITTIRFSATERDDNFVVICEDDGDGVPADEKEKIFERGFGKNTGLGLALSREILAFTGITIAETGTPGNGARFEIVVQKGMFRK
jgi:PAS domain S-box-containing protein